MLKEEELEFWFKENQIPSPTCEMVRRIRSSEPSRNTKGGRGNVKGKFPSMIKMGHSIMFESHTVELPGIFGYEYIDEDVLEYWEQTEPIRLKYKSKSGKLVVPYHTPDFFIIRGHRCGWEEWKNESDLVRLSNESPERYVYENGIWRCPPGEEYAKELGCYYTIRTSNEIDQTLYRNLQFLEDYYIDNTDIPSEDEKKILTAINNELGITLLALMTQSDISPDYVYQMISRRQIYINLSKQVLATPEDVNVFRNQEASLAFENVRKSFNSEMFTPTLLDIDAGGRVNWEGRGWTILNVGEENIALINDEKQVVNLPLTIFMRFVTENKIQVLNLDIAGVNSEAKERLNQADEPDMAVANKRFNIVQLALDGKKDLNIPSRTVRSWIKAYKDAEAKWGDGYLGLLPQHKKKGNRTSRLPNRTREIMMEFIENSFEGHRQLKIGISYAVVKRLCTMEGVPYPSKTTFEKTIKMRDIYLQTLKRKGSRAAYNYKDYYWHLDQTTPVHGDRPFAIAHIDHTQIELEVIDSTTNENLGRPWLTIMVDAFSRRFLAFSLSFDPPSYRSCMMVIRECVRRHSRLPNVIIVDNGKEFQGTYFETLLARYRTLKKDRPPAQARFGSFCERLLGTTQTQFIHTLSGNTQIMHSVRQVTKSVNPKNEAVWTLPALYEALSKYAYEIYDTNPHQSLNQSPRECFRIGMALSGNRLSRIIPYDYFFKIYTLPTTESGKAKVDSVRGIQIKKICYSNPLLKNPKVIGQKVQVRYDPWDISHAYAYVNNQWIECKSNHFSAFYGRTEKEIEIATMIIRERKRYNKENAQITERQLADFFMWNEDKENQLKIQRVKDRELKMSLEIIEGGKRNQIEGNNVLNEQPNLHVVNSDNLGTVVNHSNSAPNMNILRPNLRGKKFEVLKID